jgi:hypothetical protein
LCILLFRFCFKLILFSTDKYACKKASKHYFRLNIGRSLMQHCVNLREVAIYNRCVKMATFWYTPPCNLALVGHVIYQTTAILYKETYRSSLPHFTCFYNIYSPIYCDGPQFLVNYKISSCMRNLSVFCFGKNCTKNALAYL